MVWIKNLKLIEIPSERVLKDTLFILPNPLNSVLIEVFFFKIDLSHFQFAMVSEKVEKEV